MRGRVLLATLLLAGLAPPARAEVRSGASDGTGALSVAYDDAAGTVTIALAAPGGTVPVLDSRLQTYCAEYPKPADSPGAELPVTLAAGPGGLTLSGGELPAPVADPGGVADGVFRATVATPVLGGRDVRCVEGTLDGAPVTLYFTGYRHVPLTAAGAEAAVTADLARRFGQQAASAGYRACPAARITDAALCRYRVLTGGRVRVGTYLVDETETALGATLARSDLYSPKIARCPARYQRDARAGSTRVVTGKRLEAPRFFCGSVLPRTLIARSVARFPAAAGTITLLQTPAKGFEPLSRFTCRPGATRTPAEVRYRWRCANALGDTVRFSFRVARYTRPLR